MSSEDLTIPFTNPVLVFAIVLLSILVTPLLLSRLKIPGVVGLILIGVALGPNGLHILERDTSIILFGTVGLLYIMFLAGLEMDMNDFKKNKNKSMVFGALTFLFPFLIGFVAARYLLHYQVMAAVLLASMFSTHTLVAYPIITKLGITQTRTVVVVIGGTIITDAAVLLMLAVITNLKEQELSFLFFGKLFLLLTLLVFTILWGVPKLGRWFFRTLESEGHSQYLFVLTIVFVAGFLSHLAGVEPIIGAFLAGLALNQLIPNASTLMNRIEFIGNTLFIPFFLISVGMLVDLRVLAKGPETLLIAAMIIAISFLGKWLAAFVTQKIYTFTNIERKLIWGMSSGHAAATIAVVVIGYNLKLFDENVLNGTILLILVSCLGSSVISENAGRQIAIEEENAAPSSTKDEERILVPVSNLENVDRLIDLAIYMRDAKSGQPIYPLLVLPDNRGAGEKILQYEARIERQLQHSGTEIIKQPIFRMDLNIGNGILRAVTELRISDIVIGWNGHASYGKSFGPILDHIVRQATVQILIARILQPLNTAKKIILAIPEHAEKEKGFPDLVETILQLAKSMGASLTIFSVERSYQHFCAIMEKGTTSQEPVYQPFHQWTNLLSIIKNIEPHDVFIAIQARPQTISYNSSMEKVPRLLIKYINHNTAIVMYPKQA